MVGLLAFENWMTRFGINALGDIFTCSSAHALSAKAWIEDVELEDGFSIFRCQFFATAWHRGIGLGKDQE
jgi:hypothetical protein